MIPPRLPPELIASIFNILATRHDWDSIRACSLLSSQFSPLARQYLFSVVKLKLKSCVSIRDLVRRVQGLSQLLQTNTHTNRCIKTLEILDTYPVYDSQWITQQSCLPHFLSLLEYVQSCTFGCEVGYLAWSSLSPELQTSLRKLFLSPQLKALSLRNLGSIPVVILRNPVVRYLSLNHVSILSPDLLDDDTESQLDDLPATQLVYLNIRTVSTENTESVSRLMESQGQNLKIIKWRCWEDPQSSFGSSLPGTIDIGILPSLKKLSFRLSFGDIGRDLVGLCDLLDSASQPMEELRVLEIFIVFPNQSAPHRILEIRRHIFWSQLATVLEKPEYSSLRHLSVHLTIRRKARTRERHAEDSVAEFKKQIKHALRHVSNMSTLQFRFKVHAFNQDQNQQA